MSDTGFQEFESEQFVRRLGIIDEAKFGFEDHGLFGFHIGINFGGTHGGTGWITDGKNNLPSNGKISYLQLTLLETFHVERWESLKGQVVWALFDKKDPWNSPVRGLQQPEFAGSGVWVIDYVLEAARNRRQHDQNQLATLQNPPKIISRQALEKVTKGAETMLLQGADTKVAREWAEEIVADVMALTGAVVEP